MQTIDSNILIAVAGLLLSALTFVAGTKKANKAAGYFEGLVTAKLDELGKKIDKFEDKLSHNSEKFYTAIDAAIKDHEERFHSVKK